MRYWVIALFFFMFIGRSWSQPICEIDHYSTSDGLSQGFIESMLQDKNGLLWFCTWNGLDCYDGYSFTNYNNLSTEHGDILSTNRITNIYQTKYGDIWCWTYDGNIYLFDIRKKCFIDVLTDIEKEIKHKIHVTSVIALPKGVTWVIDADGYNLRFDERLCKEGKGITLYNSDNKNLKGDKIFTVYQDRDNDEWVLTDKGITIIGNKTIKSDLPFKRIRERGNDVYLVSASDKFARYNRKTGDLHFIDMPSLSGAITNLASWSSSDELGISATDGFYVYSISNQSFRKIDVTSVEYYYVDSKGYCWMIISSENKVVRVDVKTLEKKVYEVSAMHYVKRGDNRKGRSFAFEDKNDNLWIMLSRVGMYYYNREDDKLEPYLLNEADPNSYFVPFVRGRMFDSQKNLWFTSDDGVTKIIFLPDFFNFIEMDQDQDVRAFLCDDKNRLWLSSKAEFIRLFDEKLKLNGYFSKGGDWAKLKTSFEAGVYSMLQDKEGKIWLGTRFDGLYVLTPSGTDRYKIENYRYDKDNSYSLSHNAVYSIFQDSKNRIWVATFGGGLNLVEKDDRGMLRFINYNNKLKNYPMDEALKIRSMNETADGVLMLGTTNGLVTFSSVFDHPEEVKFYYNSHRKNDGKSLNSNDIMHVYSDSVIGTCLMAFSGGINKVVSSDLLSEHIEFRHYTTANGLLSNLVKSMIRDNEGNYWIIMENGIALFNYKQGNFINYHSDLFHNDMKFSEAVPLLYGNRLLLGTNMGLLELFPQKLHRDKNVPKMMFSDFRIESKPLGRNVNYTDTLFLDSDQRNISFRFCGIDYIGAQYIQYAYRLKGLETEWNDAGNSRSASYMNLPAGTYTLEIKSTNSDGIWMDNVKRLTLVIEPTFNETVWASILYIFLILVMIAATVYVLLYIYKLRARIGIEKQMSEIKLRFFTDISHELRTPLTLIAGPVAEVLENEKLSETARNNLNLVSSNSKRMLRLMNQILDFRKIQNKRMKVLLEYVDVVAAMRTVMNSFNSVAYEKHIQFSLSSSKDELYAWIDRDKFEKIFFNLLSNAFKYTPDGKSVKVEISLQADYVRFAVIDTGTGIEVDNQKHLFERFENFIHYDTTQPSSGIGLSLVKEMVDIHHGRIGVDSKLGEGSRFYVDIPLDKSVYEGDSQVEFILDDAHKNEKDKSLGRLSEPQDEEDKENETSVLIVEDNIELRSFLYNSLASSYKVLQAENGQQGLDMAKDFVPDIIVSDLMMPVMDGMEMIKRIKEDNMICHIPIIILSARSSLDDKISGIEQGVDDYITKPFSATYLRVRIAALLKKRKELQQYFMERLTQQLPAKAPAESVEEKVPEEPKISVMDELFMQQVMDFMEENMSNEDLEIESFAEKLCVSRAVFYRKLKSITGYTPVEFVRIIRLKRAIQLIKDNSFTVSELAYMTGFSDPKYFARCFKKMTGMTPTEYREQTKK